MRVTTGGGWVLLAVALAQSALAQAQYPTRTIRFIVPFAAGSANDIMARIVAPPLSEALGRPVVIDNRPGAGGNIGAELAAHSPPDGYTLMMCNVTLAINVTLYSKLGYDLVKDLVPVAWLASGSFLMVAHPSVPARSVKELIALAKARPGELNVATGGGGLFLVSELFLDMAGVKMTNVPYRSAPPAITALIGGEASVGFAGTSGVVPHVRSAKLRALAVTSARRSPMVPDVPTIAEAGVPSYEASSWYGLMVPAKTPSEITSRLHAESVKALDRRDVKERFGTTDFQIVGAGPEQFGTHIRNEISKWGKIVRATGLRPE